jgi:hypothetical protein
VYRCLVDIKVRREVRRHCRALGWRSTAPVGGNPVENGQIDIFKASRQARRTREHFDRETVLFA